jgi:hypothetical protein
MKAWEEHTHWVSRQCTDYTFCTGPSPVAMVSWGLSAMETVARSLMEFYDVDPSEYPEKLLLLEQEVGETLLDLGREFLSEHDIPSNLPEQVTR